MHKDPIVQFKAWYEDAKAKEPSDPDAVALASAGADGRPSVRMILMRGLDERGFLFYTNLTSNKALAMRDNPYASMCFHWKSLARQVRIDGAVELLSDAEADAYFASRPRESQVGAWASKQSQPLEGRFELEARFAKYLAKFGIGKVPRPDFWSGYRLVADEIEFWDKRPYRLHDRTLYRRTADGWEMSKLYP